MTTTRLSDRWTSRADDLVVTPLESAADRATAFLKSFGLPAEGGTFFDRSGYPMSISPATLDGLDRFSSAELQRAARAMVAPVEIRRLWQDGRDGSKMWTNRYLAQVDGVDVAVDVNRAGWRFATSEDPEFDLDQLKHGELAWSTPA